MANYLYRVITVFEKWASGGELSEQEVYEASGLLGTPTRKLEVFLQRFRDVIGRLIEERCSDVDRGRVCIYTWSRWAFKRYFPAALDAGGTIVWYVEPGVAELVSYPLHRALDLDVHGVRLPGEDPVAAVPRLDGWQVNMYYDPVVSRWMFSTRYVLHNMRFEGRRLVTEEYGSTINPLVETAERIARRVGLYAAVEGLRGWTLTFMVVGGEPASAARGLPDPDDAENYQLYLVAARKPSGELVPPYSGELAELGLPVPTVSELAVKGSVADLHRAATESIEYPSMFLWYDGDPEHPRFYEAKSAYYSDYIAATRRMDAKSLVVLVTSGSETVVERLREELGSVVDEVRSVVDELRGLLERAEPGVVEKALARAGLGKQGREAARALAKGKVDRALRIIAASAVAGLGVGEAGFVLKSLLERIREEASATGAKGSA